MKEMKFKPSSDLNEELLTDKLVKISRCAKTTKGGRTFSFRGLVTVGNGKGAVGYGIGKAKDVRSAMKKGRQEAMKKMCFFPLRNNRTIHYAVTGKYKGSKVFLSPAAPGSGIKAGPAVRSILEGVGIKDVLSKSYGSTNSHNVVHATFEALSKLRTPKMVAKQRAISLEEVFNG